MPVEKDVQYYEELVRENVADKTLSFGCKIISKSLYSYDWNIKLYVWEYIYLKDNSIMNNIWDIYEYVPDIWFEEYIKILWHEVMIWDFLDWIEKNIDYTEENNFHFIDRKWTIKWEIITTLFYWKHKRLPYSSQSDEVKIELGKIVEEVLLSKEK